jgi:4-alpha-glucanotransferase
MSDADLHRIARKAGIATRWEDFRGDPHEVAPDTLRRLLSALDLPCDTTDDIAESGQRLAGAERTGALPPMITADAGAPVALHAALASPGTAYAIELEGGGRLQGRLEPLDADGASLPAIEAPGYHRLRLGDSETLLAVAPRRCPGVQDVCGRVARKPWALATQLYGLVRPGDGGIGTYGALADLVTRVARQGAAALAVSPVHAMFSAEPAHRSPYSPSSRLLLNVLHIDPGEAFGALAAAARETLGLGGTVARLEAMPLIDWRQAGAARLAVLRHLFEHVLDRDEALQASFQSWRDAAGTTVEDHARFEALHAHFLASGTWSWRNWPASYRDPRSAAVAEFAREHRTTVRFHAFAQWLAARGLGGAQAQALAAGMPIGLITDLAIGSDPNGSHVWSRQHETLVGASIGAPPDPLAMQGQAWGLASLSPTAMRDTGFSAFIELLRANMAHAGGVRIDHVMGLKRLWLVPDGASPLDGAYLEYPCADLLRLVALEAHRHRCVVIGEDLGTVPAGFGDTLADRGVLGMGVLWFERDSDGGFLPAARWRQQAIAMTTTHDLPTAAGWWLGRDIEVRAGLGLDAEEALASQRAQRERERVAIWAAVHDGGAGAAHDSDSHADRPLPCPASGATAEFVDAAVAHVGRTPAALAVVPLEDILGITDAPNVPGTTDEQPNWRRRLPADLDTLLDSEPARRRIGLLDQARAPVP